MKNEILKNQKWFAKIPLEHSSGFLECAGSGKIINDVPITKISVPFNGMEHIVAEFEGTRNIKICSFPGGIQRCYARIKNNNLLIGNTAMALFEKGEKIRLNSEVLLREMFDLVTPIDDLFSDVTLLEPSSIFCIKNNEIVFEESTIKPVQSNPDLVHEFILNEFEKICRSGQPLAVLLSAGIDSRLNLVLCKYFSKKYGNEIITYHEYKDKKEHDIAKDIADKVRVPFVSVSRDRFKKEPLEILLSPEFIEFNSGLYRESLLRWIPYMDWMKDINPDCKIIGMGSEAHKGKFYRDIKDLSKDAKHILGGKVKISSDDESEFLPFVSEKTMSEFFPVLLERSLIFNKLSSKIDFIHYHTYAAKHSIARSPYFNSYYGMPFPFLDDKFLSMVFSLLKKEKADAKLSLGLINKLAPEFSSVPFISGNAKGFRNHYISILKDELNRVLPKFVDTSRRNENISWNDEMILNHINGSSSEITAILERFIKNNISKPQRKGTIKIKCALKIYLFLRQAEKDLGIEFICK